jgi:hypothetical protein
MIRLLHIRTKEFKEFHDLESVPLYAILSHRWMHAQRNGKYRALELSHAEFLAGTGDDRGYEKIDKACEAVRDLSHKLELELQWIWIDSCCIDKSINEELTEAINSMYEWYAKSYVCIAYLDDADPFGEANPSGWFKRGWTLQELIAPERVLFYNKNWIGCGSRNEYSPGPYGEHSFQDRSQEIATITRIDGTLLKLTKRKEIKRRLDSIPACQKMSWASDRETTKDEDMAYCLIGIFDIPHMHLKRGEGRRAFIRLQEEIIKQSNDLTLFAWKLSGDSRDACLDDNCLSLEDLRQGAPENAPFFDSSPKSDLHGVFACGPSHFRLSSRIEPTQLAVYNNELTITSRGVKLITPLLGSGPFLPFKMPLYCTDGGSSKLLAMELRLLGGSIYARTNCTRLPLLHKDAKVVPNQDDVFLAHNIQRFQGCAGEMHKHAIHLPETILGSLERVHVSPGYLWSSKHNLVITNGCRFFVGYAKYELKLNRVSASGTFAVNLIFGLDHLQRPWFCLSGVDKSFEPRRLESRSLYLERVWRPASQHPETACLDGNKTFKIPGQKHSEYIRGSMRAVRRQHCDRDVFDVDFTQARARLDIVLKDIVEADQSNASDGESVDDSTENDTSEVYQSSASDGESVDDSTEKNSCAGVTISNAMSSGRFGARYSSENLRVAPLRRWNDSSPLRRRRKSYSSLDDEPEIVVGFEQHGKPRLQVARQEQNETTITIRQQQAAAVQTEFTGVLESESMKGATPVDPSEEDLRQEREEKLARDVEGMREEVEGDQRSRGSDVGEEPPDPASEKNLSQGQDQLMRDVEGMQNEAEEENPLVESAAVKEQPDDSHTPAIASSKSID